jgi:hypothetical protein
MSKSTAPSSPSLMTAWLMRSLHFQSFALFARLSRSVYSAAMVLPGVKQLSSKRSVLEQINEHGPSSGCGQGRVQTNITRHNFQNAMIGKDKTKQEVEIEERGMLLACFSVDLLCCCVVVLLLPLLCLKRVFLLPSAVFSVGGLHSGFSLVIQFCSRQEAGVTSIFLHPLRGWEYDYIHPFTI